MITVRIDIVIGYLGKWKTYGPVMWQLYRRPGPVVKVHFDTGVGGITRFGEDIADAVIEIPVRISRMTKMKSPAIVKILTLTDRLRVRCCQLTTSYDQENNFFHVRSYLSETL